MGRDWAQETNQDSTFDRWMVEISKVFGQRDADSNTIQRYLAKYYRFFIIPIILQWQNENQIQKGSSENYPQTHFRPIQIKLSKWLFPDQSMCLVYLIIINMNPHTEPTPSKLERVTFNHQNQLSQTHSELNQSYLTHQPYSSSPRHRPFVNNPSIYSDNSDKFDNSPLTHRKSLHNSHSRVRDKQETNYNYEAIEQILKKENKNLQQQNQLLLKQIQRLRMSNKKYKSISQNQTNQIEQLREQCEAHKRYADQMKGEILQHVKQLEKKALEQSDSQAEQSLIVISGLSLNQSNSNREE